jgi:hypothetical protein
MGGTNKGGGTPEQIQESQLADQNALTSLAQQQGANSNTLFNLGLPGLQTSENQAATLASGDPDAIAKLVAPAAQQVQTATSSIPLRLAAQKTWRLRTPMCSRVGRLGRWQVRVTIILSTLWRNSAERM